MSNLYSKKLFLIVLAFLMCQSPNAAQDAATPPPAAPPIAGNAEFEAGMALYRQRRYAEAAEYFWKSITAGNTKATPWLNMGHAQLAAGRKFEAVKAYRTTVNIFRGTAEAQLAAAQLKRIDPLNNMTEASSGDAKIPPPPADGEILVAKIKKKPGSELPPSVLPSVKTFKERIEIVKPLSSHPAVTRETIDTINKAIAKLPPSIFKILDENGARTYIVPNMVDKWPEARLQEREDGTTLATDIGRTYGRDMYVCQQTVDPTSNAVKETQTQKDIEAVFYNEVGHALDDVLKFSSKDEVKKAYEEDVETVDRQNKDRFYLYLKEGDTGRIETCAEVVAALLGGNGNNTQMMPSSFPKTYYAIKQILKI